MTKNAYANVLMQSKCLQADVMVHNSGMIANVNAAVQMMRTETLALQEKHGILSLAHVDVQLRIFVKEINFGTMKLAYVNVQSTCRNQLADVETNGGMMKNVNASVVLEVQQVVVLEIRNTMMTNANVNVLVAEKIVIVQRVLMV